MLLVISWACLPEIHASNLYVSGQQPQGNLLFADLANIASPPGVAVDANGNFGVASFANGSVASSVTTANEPAVVGVPKPATWFLIGLGLGFGRLIRRWIA